MVCRACGRIIANENANFCEYCGTATNINRDGGMEYGSAKEAGNNMYRQDADWAKEGASSRDSSYHGTSNSGVNAGNQPGLAGILSGNAGLAETENSVGFLHWVVIMLLPFIPMIGIFAYLAVLIIWAFGHSASTTRKNWARATLLVTAVSFLMVMYMFQSILGSEGMAELMNSMVGTGGIS
ncbi:MAG: hypothetical protein K2N63_12170 [Lachnospiraceae bacterium]|nr:hypothetical protein [Lachnospiraceae bacterium]